MSLNDKRSWWVEDTAPQEPLESIHPVSVRAEALIARSSSVLLQSDFLRYFGVVDIFAGLEYHFAAYVKELEELPILPGKGYVNVRHEAIAWLGRLGQLYYFCTSAPVAAVPSRPPTPRIEALLPFRQKHAAHRSIDQPRRDDTDHLQVVQAFTLSRLAGSLWAPRPGVKVDVHSFPSHATHFAALQLQLPGDHHENLILEREHPAVLAEGYAVLEAALAASCAAAHVER